MDSRLKGIFFLLPVITFLLTFFYYPMLSVILLAFTTPAHTWIIILVDPILHRFLFFTLFQAILTVLISLIIGLPAGYLLARKNPYVPNLLRSLISVPFLFPPLAILLGFVVLFGDGGFVTKFINFNAYSFSGIVLAHVMYNISVISRISESAFANEPAELHVIAETLGAGKINRFRTITIPHLKPSVEAGLLLIFLYSFNSFAIVLILGEVKLQTIEVMIYSQSRIRLNFDISAILVFIQLIINLLIILYYTRRQYYKQVELNEIVLPNDKNRILSTFALIIIILFSWMPILILLSSTVTGIVNSPDIFREKLFSGNYDRILGTSSLRVIINTIFFGLITALISLIFSFSMVLGLHFFKNKIQVERLFTLLTLLPMATSAISLSFALINTHGNNKYFNEFVWVFIIIAQLLAALPFASRSMLTSWKRVPSDLLLVSETLSASVLMTFERVVIPYMKSAIIVAILFSFAISIGEFGATYYLSRGEWITLSISIYKMFSSRNVILPYIYASMLVLTSLIIFLTIEKIGKLEMKL